MKAGREKLGYEKIMKRADVRLASLLYYTDSCFSVQHKHAYIYSANRSLLLFGYSLSEPVDVSRCQSLSAGGNNGPVSAQRTWSSCVISVIVEIKVGMSHHAFSSFDRNIQSNSIWWMTNSCFSCKSQPIRSGICFSDRAFKQTSGRRRKLLKPFAFHFLFYEAETLTSKSSQLLQALTWSCFDPTRPNIMPINEFFPCNLAETAGWRCGLTGIYIHRVNVERSSTSWTSLAARQRRKFTTYMLRGTLKNIILNIFKLNILPLSSIHKLESTSKHSKYTIFLYVNTPWIQTIQMKWTDVFVVRFNPTFFFFLVLLMLKKNPLNPEKRL